MKQLKLSLLLVVAFFAFFSNTNYVLAAGEVCSVPNNNSGNCGSLVSTICDGKEYDGTDAVCSDQGLTCCYTPKPLTGSACAGSNAEVGVCINQLVDSCPVDTHVADTSNLGCQEALENTCCYLKSDEPDPGSDKSNGGLVPCGQEGQDGCNFCHLVEMGNTVITWLIGVLFVVFAVIATSAGFGLVMSAGNVEAKTAAKNKMTSAVIGFIIVLAAWLLVDTIMRSLLTGGKAEITTNWGLWSKVECVAQPVATGGTGGTNPPPTEECLPETLIAKYGGSPVGLVHPDLQKMISCYMASPVIAESVDSSQLYTTDRSHPKCSLTNGTSLTSCGVVDVGETCSHSANSMHYGRGSGQGAMAVDFNVKVVPGGRNELDLYFSLKIRQNTCGGTLLYEGDHTHISI